MEEKKTDSLGDMKFKAPITPPAIPAGKPSVIPTPIPKPIPVFVPAAPAIPKPPTPLMQVLKPAPTATPIPAARKQNNDITIQTMQDDLTALNSSNTKGTSIKGVAGVSTSSKTPLSSLNNANNTSNKTFPLPPKNSTQKQKVVINPLSGREPNWRVLIGGGAAAIIILAGIGFGAWYWLTKDSNSVPSGQAADASALIPANADMVVEYSLTSDADRATINTLWAKNGEASASSLMRGDPRLLIADNQTTDFFYIALAGDTRPYLLAPQTSPVSKLLKNNPDIVVTDQDGWFIANQIDPNPYKEALKVGTLASSKQADLLKQASQGSSLSALVRTGTLSEMRSSLGGKKSAKGAFQAVALQLKTSPSTKSLSFVGAVESSATATSASATQAAPQMTSQKLLEALPSDVTVAHVGANFGGDIQKWQDNGGPFKPEALAPSAVAQTLKNLTVPYAWYTRTGPDTIQDTGLVVDLTGLPTPPVLGDAGIEQGLAALVPLLMEQPLNTPVAFKDGVYNTVPLRFVNILGPTIALDYAISNNYLLVASSKEGIFSLLDTVAKKTPSALTSITWQSLFSEWGKVPEAQDIIFGAFNLPVAAKLLPLNSSDGSLRLGATVKNVNNALEVTGFILTPSQGQ